MPANSGRRAMTARAGTFILLQILPPEAARAAPALQPRCRFSNRGSMALKSMPDPPSCSTNCA